MGGLCVVLVDQAVERRPVGLDPDDALLGVQVPVDRLTVGVNYTGVKYENAAGANATLGKAALMGWYTLSKSTFLYSGISFSTGDLTDYIADNRVFLAGIRLAW